MKSFLFLSLALFAMSANAQTKAGGISQEMLQKIEQSQKNCKTQRALRNAIASNNINNLAKNPQKQGPVDNHFSVETTSQSIHDQKSSGRCWMFTSMNVLRSDFARQHKDTLAVEFSHDYTFFFDQLEKSNLFLQGAINTAAKDIEDPEVKFFFKAPINDGGTFCGIIDLTAKYGLVPKCVMPETYQSENSRLQGQIISTKLREFGLELRKMVQAKKKPAAIEARKTEMLAEVYRILSMTLGEPVKEFKYAHRDKTGKIIGEEKTYTPQSFYKEVAGDPMAGKYAMLMNDPRHPYYKVYEVQHDRHVYDGHNWLYVNLPVDRIKDIAISSIRDGKAMYFSCDVAKFLNSKKGVLDIANYDYSSLFGIDLNMDKRQRVMTHASGSSHAMTLMAVDIRDDKPLKWMVENSWGAESGYKGHLIMTDEWFNEYMFRLVAEKKYVPSDVLEMLKQEPVRLPAWDPMFAPEE